MYSSSTFLFFKRKLMKSMNSLVAEKNIFKLQKRKGTSSHVPVRTYIVSNLERLSLVDYVYWIILNNNFCYS